ncbi:MAG: NAD-dependent deacylase [Candidatus Cloacimonetes bacterium]|nr:NAD-dependent deacylase [Candidatus Cloacimonadota bacterium]
MKIPKINQRDFLMILTGAGISAESGIKTFRDSDGLWENHRVEDVATPEGFKQNPKLVWKFYKERYFQSLEVNPNLGHEALVELENRFKDNFLLVTQNVDGLHTRAGSKRVIEMHGTLNTCFCTKCKKKYTMSEVDLEQEIPPCLACEKPLRPDIVWFGEMPYQMDEIYAALDKTTVFMTIGTSGNVYPAAYFIAQARQRGARTIGVNLAEPENSSYIDFFFQGKAGDILPKMVEEMIE